MSEGLLRHRRGNPSQAYAGPRTVRKLIEQALCDSDAVSVNGIGDSVEDCEVAVVVLKGNAVVRMFVDWATRNKVLSEGKPIEDKAPTQLDLDEGGGS